MRLWTRQSFFYTPLPYPSIESRSAVAKALVSGQPLTPTIHPGSPRPPCSLKGKIVAGWGETSSFDMESYRIMGVKFEKWSLFSLGGMTFKGLRIGLGAKVMSLASPHPHCLHEKCPQPTPKLKWTERTSLSFPTFSNLVLTITSQ